jgi:hypothetical protein
MPEVQGRHLKRWTLRAMLSSDFRDRAIPWTKLLIRTRQVPATLNLGWRHRISAVTVLTTPIAAALTMQSLALLAGLLAMVLVNRRFYGDLARHGGAKLAMLGIALHVVHHASAILALPFGAASHLRHGAVRAPLPLQPVEMVA